MKNDTEFYLSEKKFYINPEKLKFLRYLRQNKKAFVGILMIAFLVVVAVFADLIAQYPYDEMHHYAAYIAPNSEWWFGTDEYGRDIFSRIVYGTRISLLSGIVVSSIAAIIGIPMGLVAGYFGRYIDIVIMRITDVIFTFPALLLALVIAVIMGPGLNTVLIAFSIVYAPQFARVVRSAVLSVKEKEYVEAAIVAGENNRAILFKYVFPNCFGPIIVMYTLFMSFAILAEAAMSFIGLGTQPPTPSWGLILSDGAKYLARVQYYPVFPGLAIMYTVLAFNLFGDGLRDIFDPHLRMERR